MAKKKTDEVNGNVADPEIPLDHPALSLIRDEDNADWVIVKVMYDFKTGKTGEPEILLRERNNSLASERFRIMISQMFL